MLWSNDPATTTYGESLTLVATVSDTDPTAMGATPVGTVTFSATPQGGSTATPLGSVSVESSGQFTLSLTSAQSAEFLTAGSYTVVADYSDPVDHNFIASDSTSATMTVNTAAPTITPNLASNYYVGSENLDNIETNATITPSGPIGSVTNVPGTSLEGVGLTYTFYSGTTQETLNYVVNNAGNYSVDVSFAGSTDYAATSVPVSFSIGNEQVPTITLTAPSEVYDGQPYAAATATLTPSDTGSNGTTLEGVGLTLDLLRGSTATQRHRCQPTPGTYTVDGQLPGQRPITRRTA